MGVRATSVLLEYWEQRLSNRRQTLFWPSQGRSGGGGGWGRRPFISGELQNKKSKDEGIRGTKAILGIKEHRKSRF